MLFLPSQEIHDRLRVELAGVFIDRSLNSPDLWLVAKPPMNLIRDIRAGSGVSLLAWMVEIDDNLIAAFGLRVYDDQAAPAPSSARVESTRRPRTSVLCSRPVAFPSRSTTINSCRYFR